MHTDDAAAPYHAHIYFESDQLVRAQDLQAQFNELKASGALADLLFVGRLRDGKAGPHPISQFEIHFPKRALPDLMPLIEGSALRALVHPLTDDDLADHTSLAHWVGEPIDLDLTTLDPPGMNQGVPRYGKTDF
jgi:aromatic ring-cleaving dioxygenase